MKKALFFSVALVSASVMFGQRINNATSSNATVIGFAALNPTNNNATKPGKAFVIIAPNTDLTNMNLTLECGTQASIIEPTTLPTNWSEMVRVKLQNDGTTNTDWALYDISCRTIKAATLPITNLFKTDDPNIGEWDKNTVGWVSMALEEGFPIARIGSAKRGFMLAFTNTPDMISYTISLATTDDTPENIFDVEESIDGITWTSVVKYTGTGKEATQMPLSAYLPAEKIRSQKLLSSTRFVRFIFTSRKAGNVNVQDLSVTKSVESAINKVQIINRLMVQGSELVIAANETIIQLDIMNLNGQLVKRITSPEARINISDLAGGCYIAKVVSDQGNTSAQRFVK